MSDEQRQEGISFELIPEETSDHQWLSIKIDGVESYSVRVSNFVINNPPFLSNIKAVATSIFHSTRNGVSS